MVSHWDHPDILYVCNSLGNGDRRFLVVPAATLRCPRIEHAGRLHEGVVLRPQAREISLLT